MFKLFGGLFDFNNDGDVDIFEKAVEIDVVTSIMGDDEEDEKEELMRGLEVSGLCFEELECMDYEERIEALEEAGLDSGDYDFIELRRRIICPMNGITQ